MDATLMDSWLGSVDAELVFDGASVTVVRERVREVAAARGLPTVLVESMALVASELGHNQLRYARTGRMLVRAVERRGAPGLEVVAADRGCGLRDPVRALAGELPSSSGLGAGVSAVGRLSDELDVDVRFGEGTCIRARRFLSTPAFRSEVCVLGRAFQGESTSGDHAVFARTPTGLVGMVIDGLGHGPAAASAARRAGALLSPDVLLSPEVLRSPEMTSPAAWIEAADAALVGTRGAVATAFRLDRTAGFVEYAGVGNVLARVVGPRSDERLSCEGGILGAGQLRRAPRVRRRPFGERDLLVVATDGISSRLELDAPLRVERPVVVAQRLLERYGRSTDDALVLVAR